VLVRRSKQDASDFQSSMGWRVHSPDEEHLKRSMNVGLHPEDKVIVSQPSCLLPLNDPPRMDDGRVSGPLWTGTLGEKNIMGRLTEERALELCGADLELQDEMGVKLSNRIVSRSVRGVSESAESIDCPILIAVDELPKYLDIAGPPSPSKLAQELREQGYRAAPAVLQVPAIRTDAPWSFISKAAQAVFSSQNTS